MADIGHPHTQTLSMETEFGEDEVLIGIATASGTVIDAIQITTNLRSFPRSVGTGINFGTLISSTELLYVSGSEIMSGGVHRFQD